MNPEESCERLPRSAPQARVYISGPISGRLDRNRPLFRRMAEIVEEAGHIAVNPLELDASHAGACRGGDNLRHPHDTSPPDEHQYGCYMLKDLKALLDCDMILMLPNWLESRGAKIEHKVAEAIGLEIMSVGEDIPGRLRLWRERVSFRHVTYQRATEHGVPLPTDDTQDATAPAGELW